MNKKSAQKKYFNDRRGFISIIAIGIFALLAIFGIMIQLNVVDTYQNLKNNNNYYSARDLADSTIEYLQSTIKNHEAGFNSKKITCHSENGVITDLVEGGGAIWNMSRIC